MSKKFKNITMVLSIVAGLNVWAGNEDRVGQAGGLDLLINPWSRSAGFAGANSAGVRGLEAQFLNVAGTAFTKKTELLFTHTRWFEGAGIDINAFGFSQKVGETGVVGLGFMSMGFGDIQITTVDQPEGGIGTFSPSFFNLGLSYAKAFSEDIYAGLNMKVISHTIPNIQATGVALDAGIQYVTGATKNIKFGIALKNVGPRMQYTGDGLSFRAPFASSAGTTVTVEQRSEGFELPSLINIGLGYDIYVGKDSAAVKAHRITIMGNFTSNSFGKDEYRLGVEYGFKSFLMVRLGYNYEEDIESKTAYTTAFLGPCGGFTVEVPFGANKSTFGLDYSYRLTFPFNGVHSIGARINL